MWPRKVAAVLREHGLAGEPRRRRHRRDAGAGRAARPRASRWSTGSRCSWRPAGSRPRDEIAPAHPGLLDGRRRVRASCTSSSRPGVRENECVGLVSKVLYDLGSEYVEGVNAISGERCSPHPHVFSDRHHPARATRRSSTSCTATSATAPATTGCFAVGSASPAHARRLHPLPRVHGPGDRAWSGRARPPPTSCRCGRRAQEFGFPDEKAAFALQYGHGVGLSIWEKPIFSRLVSLDHPGDPGGGHGVRAGDLLAGR